MFQVPLDAIGYFGDFPASKKRLSCPILVAEDWARSWSWCTGSQPSTRCHYFSPVSLLTLRYSAGLQWLDRLACLYVMTVSLHAGGLSISVAFDCHLTWVNQSLNAMSPESINQPMPSHLSDHWSEWVRVFGTDSRQLRMLLRCSSVLKCDRLHVHIWQYADEYYLAYSTWTTILNQFLSNGNFWEGPHSETDFTCEWLHWQ